MNGWLLVINISRGVWSGDILIGGVLVY